MDKSILVFAHMMKTAGTALTKQLIGHYGAKLHLVPGGLKMDDCYYTNKNLNEDYAKVNRQLKVITGHPLRPYLDFHIPNAELRWFTFLREPTKRYLSHYLHDYEWSENFRNPRYKSMKDKSIVEWEKIENYNNYQTKFIAGETNLDKAIEILETKMAWVGTANHYDESLLSFKGFFGLHDLCTSGDKINASLAREEMKKETIKKYGDFISEQNQIDQRLYDYFENHLWPKFKTHKDQVNPAREKPQIIRSFNTIQFQLIRQLKFSSTQLTYKNVVRFYNRWYR